jgi:hypothetical protein
MHGIVRCCLTSCLSFIKFFSLFSILSLSFVSLLSLFALLSLFSLSSLYLLSLLSLWPLLQRSACATKDETEERRGKPQRVDDERLAANLREGLSCGHMVGTGLRVLPLSTAHPPSKTERETRRGQAKAPSPGKRVEPSLAGMITAAREEEHRARANGTAAEDKVRGRGHRLKCTIAHAAIEMRNTR